MLKSMISLLMLLLVEMVCLLAQARDAAKGCVDLFCPGLPAFDQLPVHGLLEGTHPVALHRTSEVFPALPVVLAPRAHLLLIKAAL